MIKKNLAIVIVVYNIADLITKQIECIRKFCTDTDYDIIVVDNSDIKEVTDAVSYYVSSLDVIYLKTTSAYHNDSNGHAFACNMSYLKFKDDYNLICYFDHDLFMVKPFSVAETLKDKIIAGLGQSKSKDYYWPGLVMWNNQSIDHSLINFSVSHELGLDTGGMLYPIIEKYGKDLCAFFDEKYYENQFYHKTFYNFYSMMNNDTFMHFINSSNWNPVEDNKERISTLLHILEGRLV